MHACAFQVRGNTFRNCLPKRTDVEWDTRIHSWEVDAKLMLFKHVKQLTLGGNRCSCHTPLHFLHFVPREASVSYLLCSVFCSLRSAMCFRKSSSRRLLHTFMLGHGSSKRALALLLFKVIYAMCRFVKDEPRDFRGNYEDPMEFDDCSDVVHEPDTNTCYNPAYPYPTYPTSTS